MATGLRAARLSAEHPRRSGSSASALLLARAALDGALTRRMLKQKWSADDFRSDPQCRALLSSFSNHCANAQHQQSELPSLETPLLPEGKHLFYGCAPSLYHSIANGVNGDFSESKGL